MQLNGQAKQAFEEWLITRSNIDCLIRNEFYIFPESMQWGVYQDWFDSVGIYTETPNKWDKSGYLAYVGEECINDSNDGFIPFKIRTEARTVAIEKANEIFNNREI